MAETPRPILNIVTLANLTAEDLEGTETLAKALKFTSVEDLLLCFENSPQVQALTPEQQTPTAVRELFFQFIQDMSALNGIENLTADRRDAYADLLENEDIFGERMAHAFGFDSVDALEEAMNQQKIEMMANGEPPQTFFETAEAMADARGLNLENILFPDLHTDDADQNDEIPDVFEHVKNWDPTENEQNEAEEGETILELEFSEETLSKVDALAKLIGYEDSSAFFTAYFNATGTTEFLATKPSEREIFDGLMEFFEWRCFELGLDPDKILSHDEDNPSDS